MKTSKDSIELKLKEFSDLFSKEVKKLDTFCDRMKNKFDVMIGSTHTMIEDIHSFNKGYTNEMKLKTEADGKLFVNIEKSLIGFQDILSKFDFPSHTSLSQDFFNAFICKVLLQD